MSATPDDAAFRQALALYQQGRRLEAMSALDRLIARAPAHAASLHLRGFLQLEAGDAAAAEPLLRRAVAAEPRDPHAQQSLGQALRALGRREEAAAAFEGALRLDPRHANAMNGLALCLLEAGRADEAQTLLQRAIDAAPGQAQPLHNMGLVQERLGNAAAAEEHYRRALALQPTLAPARLALGRLLLEAGRIAEALPLLRAALADDAGSVEARSALALALEASGAPDEAETLLRAPPFDRHPAMGINLAILRARRGAREEALAMLDEILQRAPGLPPALHNRARVLADLGRRAESMDAFREAVAADAQNADARFGLAQALLAERRWEEGFREFLSRPLVLAAGTPRQALARASAPGLVDRVRRERRLEIVEDQGLGDMLFFLRWARFLREQGIVLDVRCTARLAPLLLRTGLFQAALGPASAATGHVAIPAGDLPFVAIALGAPATPASLHLEPIAKHVDKAKAALAAAGPAPCVGVTWRAGVPASRLGRENLSKVVEPSVLARLRPAGATVVALQRNASADERGRAQAAFGSALPDFADWHEDLEQVLGLLAALDGYVGVSNTNMHLLALLGRTATVLVPFPGEWRWAAGDAWFPGFAVVRQAADGSWPAA